MASWSQIPPEIKHLVVEKIDFMSRISLKSTSRLDRQIVLSTKCHIPRVRFGYKEGRFLVVIYTAIEQFLRIEIEKCGKGVVIYKTENSYYREDATRKFIPSTDTIEAGTSVLANLLAHKSITISTLEYELGQEETPESQAEITQFVQKFVRVSHGVKMRVEELVALTSEYLYINTSIVDWNHLKMMRKVGFSLYSCNLTPIVIHDYNEIDGPENHGKLRCYTVFGTDCPVAERFITAMQQLEYIRSDQKIPKWVTQRELIDESQREQQSSGSDDVTRKLGDKEHCPVVFRTKLSKCGIVSQQALVQHEKLITDTFKAQKCGLGDLCAEHADPFDYWYYQNMPRRVVQEPFWDGFSEMTAGAEDPDAFRRAVQKDEDKRRRCAKKNQMTSSWGFRKQEKNEAKGSESEVESKSETKDSVTSSGSEFESESETEASVTSSGNEESTKSDDRIWKFSKRFFLICLPILISFIFYYFFV